MGAGAIRGLSPQCDEIMCVDMTRSWSGSFSSTSTSTQSNRDSKGGASPVLTARDAAGSNFIPFGLVAASTAHLMIEGAGFRDQYLGFKV